jgi:SHS2 domain-containing protein
MGYNKKALNKVRMEFSGMEQQSAGYREIEHTADWEMQVWAPDFPGLLEQAARGMYALAGVRLAGKPRHTKTIELSAQDEESLLVKFLEELRYLGETEGLAFDGYRIRVAAGQLVAELSGSSLLQVSKEIKAVTFHNLAIRRTGRGLEASIVLDV